MNKLDAPTEEAMAYAGTVADALIDEFYCPDEELPLASRHHGDAGDACWRCTGEYLKSLLMEASK